MNKKQYLEKRQALLAAAQELLNAGKIDEAKEKRQEIVNLDEQWDEIAKEQANIAALEGTHPPMEMANVSVQNAGNNVVENTRVENNISYEGVFAKVALGRELTAEEIAVYNQHNKENTYKHSTTNTKILIPETVVAGIQEMMKELHPIIGEVQETTINGIVKYKKHKSIKAGDAKYYAEDEATKAEENELGEFTLTGHELAKYVTVKWKLSQMAIEDFIPFIKREISQRMAAAKARAIVKGTGVNQPTGIVTALEQNATDQIVNSPSLKYEDFTKARAKIGTDFASGVKIYCNTTTLWEGIANIMDKNGRPIFLPSPVDGHPGKVLGMTVHEEDSLADGEIIIGNVRDGYKMNRQEPMKLTQGEEGRQREHWYGGYEVNDGNVYAEEAFALIKAAKLDGLAG